MQDCEETRKLVWLKTLKDTTKTITKTIDRDEIVCVLHIYSIEGTTFRLFFCKIPQGHTSAWCIILHAPYVLTVSLRSSIDNIL